MERKIDDLESVLETVEFSVVGRNRDRDRERDRDSDGGGASLNREVTAINAQFEF